MIITLMGADFSASNIGTLSSWRISRSLGSGATYEGVTSVDKGAAFSATVTIAEGYELGTAGVTVIMGGAAISAATVNGNIITISITEVTGNVVIKVPTINLSTGEEENPSATNYRFTINPTPSDATVTLTAPGYTQNGNSITVPSGTEVAWQVTANGYLSQSGSYIVTGTYGKNIVLTSINIEDLDIATQAFVTSASVTDGITISKLDTMVRSLKSNSLWDKIEALYPCTGNSFEQMSYNLKDPTKYRLSCDGEVSIIDNSAMSCDTHQIECTELPNVLTGDNVHIMGYSLSSIKNVTPGPSNSSGIGAGVIMLAGNSLLMRTSMNDKWEANSVGYTGLFIGSLTSGIVHNGQNINATKSGTPSVSSWSADGLVINGYNDSSNYTAVSVPFTTGLAGFGYGLTIEEMTTYSQILNEFKNIY